MNISKITLGTAQLGLDYGVANIHGKPDFQLAIKMLNYAWENGINSFDTAPSYGNSEKIIGSFISSTGDIEDDIILTSKLPPIVQDGEILFDSLYNFVRESLLHTLNSLKIQYLPIYLLHHAPDILMKDGIVIDCLNELKKEGLIKRFGISAYNPEDIEATFKFKDLDVVQVPLNIFDQRLMKTGLLKKMVSKKYMIFARSIYLQGLLFIPPDKLPKNIETVKEPLIKLRSLSSEYNLEISKIALLFIRDIPGVTSLVIGSETIDQIATNLKNLNSICLPSDLHSNIIDEFSELPEKIFKPSLWNQ